MSSEQAPCPVEARRSKCRSPCGSSRFSSLIIPLSLTPPQYLGCGHLLLMSEADKLVKLDRVYVRVGHDGPFISLASLVTLDFVAVRAHQTKSNSIAQLNSVESHSAQSTLIQPPESRSSSSRLVSAQLTSVSFIFSPHLSCSPQRLNSFPSGPALSDVQNPDAVGQPLWSDPEQSCHRS